jgi:hypothetical protein
MVSPGIAFYTKDRERFCWTGGYESVTDTELEILVQQGRMAVLSLEAEIEKRQLQKSPHQSEEADVCGKKLHDCAKTFEILGRLDDRASKHVDIAVNIMKSSQSVRAFKLYQQFLYDVLRHCGSGLVLLCAASLGKQRVANLTITERVSLLDYVKAKNTSLDSPNLRKLANEHQIPTLNSAHNIFYLKSQG